MPEWYAKEKEFTEAWHRRLRIIFLDPSDIYARVNHLLDPYKRKQYNSSIADYFPTRQDGICRCGCGRETKAYGKGRHYEWYSEDCSIFAHQVRGIICGNDARRYIETYYGKECIDCKGSGCDIDHVIPVKNGGGACWLSNYVPRCHKCHVNKTKKDFKWGEYKQTNQSKLPL